MENITDELKYIKIRYKILNIIKKYNIDGTFMGMNICTNLKNFLEKKRSLYYKNYKESKTEDEKQIFNMYNQLDSLTGFLGNNIHKNNKAFINEFPTSSQNINNNLHELDQKLSSFCYNIEFVKIINEWLNIIDN